MAIYTIVDTHAHLADPLFDRDRPFVLRRAQEKVPFKVYVPAATWPQPAPTHISEPSAIMAGVFWVSVRGTSEFH
jgi:hypothetical protein